MSHSTSAPPPPAAPPSDELELLIRSRYPVLYVVSWEEARVQLHLEDVARRWGKELHCWSVTTGMQAAGHLARKPSQGVAEPLEALQAVLDSREPSIFLLKDFHPFLADNPANIPVLRKLRELSLALTDSYTTVVVVAPRLALAPELEKDVTVVDFPLPTPADFSLLLDRIGAELKGTSIELRLTPAERERLVQSVTGLTLQEAEKVFAKAIVHGGRLGVEQIPVIMAEKRQIIRKSGLLEYCDVKDGLAAVGGLQELKGWLVKRAQAFGAAARRFGLPSPRGLLLVGVQGCGKSLCAKAVSQEWELPLLRFDMGRLFSSLVGSSEENVRRAIAVAEGIAPVVLWIDEIEKAFSGLRSSGATDGGTTARVMGTLLTWLNEKTSPVFVVATANDISLLPPELMRKGRLDEIFFVDLPTAPERRQILAIHLARRRRDPRGYDLDALARATSGFSGAEIEQAVIAGLYEAFYHGRDLTTGDVLQACATAVPLSQTMSESIDALRGWAAGRARPASGDGRNSPVAAQRPADASAAGPGPARRVDFGRLLDPTDGGAP